MKKLLVLSFLLLSACGKTVVDPELQPYLDKFNTFAVQYNSSARADGISAGFIDDDGSPMVGHCKNGKIEMVRQDWEKLTENSKTQYILHELGHCALHRDHLNDKRENGWPVSIMNKYGLGELYSASTQDYYLNELFTGN